MASLDERSTVGGIRRTAVLFLCSLLAMAAARAGTTGKIAGKVTDSETKQPLPSVNIVIAGTSMGAASDLQGEYFITNIPPGTYDLKASIVGFKPLTVTGVRVRIDATTEASFEMEPTVLELDKEVVVTAQRPLVEKDNTASTVVMGSEEMSVRPATQLADVLVTLPSVNMENGQMKIRGGTLDEVSVMIDGARARNPLDQTPYMSINLSSIKEMEVITGTFNAEYGEAQSGVFNIITKEGGADYNLYLDAQYTPPGKRHWGPALYDYSSTFYWENTHARQLQWWIDNTDQWVDANGVYGYDPNCAWTPEQAYANYIATHQPLHNYTDVPSYQTEISLGGPVPAADGLFFFASGKYRSQAPYLGNAYRDRGQYFNGTAKISYNVTAEKKFILSTFYGIDKTSWGIEPSDYSWWAKDYAINSRYAFYDLPGLPESETDGQTLKYSDMLTPSSMLELKMSRVHAFRQQDVFPNDPIGWDATAATVDNLRAVDVSYDSTTHKYIIIPILGGYENNVGFHTLGYYDRYSDNNSEWKATGFYSNQLNKRWELKSGFEFSYYYLDHFNESKPERVDSNLYRPYQGAAYVQSKLEFGGLIMNLGLRYDFYNPNNVVYTDIFDPLNGPTTSTPVFSQLSPRLGISHPIDEKTVLHFSYGHFFQRGSFGDYGELYNVDDARGSLTTLVVQGTTTPVVLGNREVRPQKTVAYELGVERNFAEVLLFNVTGFYKDNSNLVRGMTIQLPGGGTYNTTANVNYGDVRGVEIGLRMLPARYEWGSASGYANFNSQMGIVGRSGAPIVITPRGAKYGPSGDVIEHNNPRLKFGLYYQTPPDWDLLGGFLRNISVMGDYEAVYMNDKLPQDYYVYVGQKYPQYYGTSFLLPADKNARLRIRKDFTIFGNRRNLGVYVQIDNLFNDKWVNLNAFKTITDDDAKRMIDSNFEDLPTVDATGVPISDLAKYRNSPRSVFFGATLEL